MSVNINIVNIGGRKFVDEADYYKVLNAMRTLIFDQRKALRSHNTDLIGDCKRREDAFISYVGEHEIMRTGVRQLNIFEVENK